MKRPKTEKPITHKEDARLEAVNEAIKALRDIIADNGLPPELRIQAAQLLLTTLL